MRIQKYLSEQGILSRRRAEEYIRAGKILVNGKKAEIGQSVDSARDKIEVLGGTAAFEAVAIYKPRGVVSSRIKKEGKTIYELFPQYEHLHITGRLDKESEGLLLLTNDGTLAKKITGEAHEVEKEYRVFVRETVRPADLMKLAKGIRLSDGMTLPTTARKKGVHEFELILREGRNHQIRRMADAVQLTVTRLVRIRIGTLTLGNLKRGEARLLLVKEINALKKL